jgi:hypothetical protein
MVDKKKYNYKYIQFTVTSGEKQLIEKYKNKENFKTLSDFMRRLVFDHIRRQENPELFIATDDSNINPILLERIAKNTLDLQDIITQREDVLEEVRIMVSNIHKLVEANSLAKEREATIKLLEKHTSLSLRQIQDETNFAEDVVFKIISDMNLFKITTAGRFSLR